LFYEIYQSAKRGENGFTPFFYPWWFSPDYTMPGVTEFRIDDMAEKCAHILNMSVRQLAEYEKYLADKYSLTPGQIAWRRAKIGELRELFFQEYPENDIDCWLSGDFAVVDGVTLRPYYDAIRPGHTEGNLTIWKDAIGGRNYVVGVDVASGSARDYSVASVLDCRTLEYVARLRGKIHPDLFSEEVIRLANRYNGAKIAVERASHGHTVLHILIERNYPNLYYHNDYDENLKVNVMNPGWVTSAKTKLPMVNDIVAAFRSGDLISWSENLVNEASGLTWENGIGSKIKTGPGGNDDEFIAVAIALQVRENSPVIEEKEEHRVRHYARVF
jgi:hypothetical protein